MNCLIVSKHGQVCDKLTRELNNIYINDNNTFDRADNVFEAKSMLRYKDIIIVDDGVDEDSLFFMDYIKKNSDHKIKAIFLCMPEKYEEMMNILKEYDNYEYWFKILIKGDGEDKLRELLK